MRKALTTLALTSTLLLVPVASASADTTSPMPAATNAVTNTAGTVDDNSDKTGLWGLLGLIGLAGLARRKQDRSTTTTYASTTEGVRL